MDQEELRYIIRQIVREELSLPRSAQSPAVEQGQETSSPSKWDSALKFAKRVAEEIPSRQTAGVVVDVAELIRIYVGR